MSHIRLVLRVYRHVLTSAAAQEEVVMLWIYRKQRDEIFIACPDGARIRIRMGDIEGRTVRVGIEAPREYRIDRNEEGAIEHSKRGTRHDRTSDIVDDADVSPGVSISDVRNRSG